MEVQIEEQMVRTKLLYLEAVVGMAIMVEFYE